MRSSLIGIVAGIGLFLALPGTAPAAEVNEAYADLNDTFEMIRTVIRAERKAVVANNLQLSGEESQAFWPVYNDYINALTKVNDRRLKLITDYAANYETLTDEQAKSLLTESLDIESAELKLKRKYVPRFEKVLPAKKVARFYQIQNKLDAITDVDLAKKIPLVQ